MNRMTKISLKALVALGCLSSVAFGQLNNTGNGTVTVTAPVNATISRLEISAFVIQQMSFGTVTRISGAAGQIQIAPAATSAAGVHGTAVINASASIQVGTVNPLNLVVWTGTRAANQTGSTTSRTYTLVLPTSVELSNPPQFGDADQTTATMVLDDFTANGGLSRTTTAYGTNGVDPTTGAIAAIAGVYTVLRWDSAQIGATLRVGATQRSGAYTGTISVECAYN